MAQPDPHPLWHCLPAQQRSRQTRLILEAHRALAWMRRRRQRIAIAIATYVLLWLIPLLYGQVLITSVALLPLLLVPPVGALVYWLVWKEFHG